MLVVPNQLVGAPLGTDVTIDCQTEAYPRPISFWMFHESRTMIFSGPKHHLVVNEEGYKAHMMLTIRSLSPEDYGSYKCVTKNSLGEAEGSMRIYGKLCEHSRVTAITDYHAILAYIDFFRLQLIFVLNTIIILKIFENNPFGRAHDNRDV